jgi:hypothetical protein
VFVTISSATRGDLTEVINGITGSRTAGSDNYAGYAGVGRDEAIEIVHCTIGVEKSSANAL